jgi:hypothetical protein
VGRERSQKVAVKFAVVSITCDAASEAKLKREGAHWIPRTRQKRSDFAHVGGGPDKAKRVQSHQYYMVPLVKRNERGERTTGSCDGGESEATSHMWTLSKIKRREFTTISTTWNAASEAKVRESAHGFQLAVKAKHHHTCGQWAR